MLAEIIFFSSPPFFFFPSLIQLRWDEGFIILIPLQQPCSAQMCLCPDERISGSMANTITYKYSCNELCWDSGYKNLNQDLR